jgi:hypothetical protein
MRFLSCLLVAPAVLSVAAIASAESSSATMVVAATFSSRTSLNVSTEMLEFTVGAPGEPALAAVDFSARARTTSGGQVVLSVEPLQEVQHGPSASESALTFAGAGEGTLSGAVAPTGSTVAGRWTGSGQHQGRLVFALRTTATGEYSVPVRFVLTAP